MKPWNLPQLFYLNPLRGALLRRQWRDILLLTSTPQDLNARSGGGDLLVLLGRIKYKQPDGVVTSSLEIRVSENLIRPGSNAADLGTSRNTSSDHSGDRKTIVQQFRLLGGFDCDPGGLPHLTHLRSDFLRRNSISIEQTLCPEANKLTSDRVRSFTKLSISDVCSPVNSGLASHCDRYERVKDPRQFKS